jgi:hypothetical protein
VWSVVVVVGAARTSVSSCIMTYGEMVFRRVPVWLTVRHEERGGEGRRGRDGEDSGTT